MAFIPVPNTCQVELVFLAVNTGVIMENTLYFEGGAPWTEGGLIDMAQDLITWWDVSMQPLMTTGCRLTNVRVTSLESQTAPGIDYSTGLPLTGSVSTPVLPGNVTWCVQFKTNLRGRSFRGRNYIPLIGDSQSDGDAVTLVFAEAIVDAYEDIFSISWTSANTPVWSVVSRYSLGAPRSPGIATEITSVAYADLVIDSQRRRLTGRGD